MAARKRSRLKQGAVITRGRDRYPNLARAGLFAFVEAFYNRHRLRKHPVFDYLTPRKHERLGQRPKLAAQEKSIQDYGETSRRPTDSAGRPSRKNEDELPRFN